MRGCWLLLLGSVFQAGCEGCDFSHGAIPVTVHPRLVEGGVPVTDDREVVVTVCAEGDEGRTCIDHPTTSDVPIETAVGWNGYVTCRRPALDVTVRADGCATWTGSLDETRYMKLPPEEGGESYDRVPEARFEAVLDCGAQM